MKVNIVIPSVGESVTEATISTILIQSGTFVKEDQEIIELETDKVNQVLPAPKSGRLELSVKVGDVVKIGQVIGFIDTAVEGAKEEKAAAPRTEPKTEPKTEPRAKQEVKPSPPPSSGPSARVMTSEFLAELKEPKSSEKSSPPVKEPPRIAEGEVTRKKMSSLRKTIAERLVMAKNQTAMLTTFNEVDMSKVMQIRDSEKDKFLDKNGVKLGFMSFFVKAVVAALKAIPEVNGCIEGDDILLFNSYDIGVAVSTDKGLMVPVVRGCDQLTFAGIEKALEGYAKKARAGGLKIDDLRGGSFTITNGGVFGSLLSTPILNPPQSAILGMHKIQKRPIVVGDQIVIRPMMYLALSYDHRIIDGKEAVKFLVHVKDSLEDPARLLLDL
jgi:2-oxoglutarate dehydrogenase E2 component (dihydrolipoamide succinyltransferase)